MRVRMRISCVFDTGGACTLLGWTEGLSAHPAPRCCELLRRPHSRHWCTRVGRLGQQVARPSIGLRRVLGLVSTVAVTVVALEDNEVRVLPCNHTRLPQQGIEIEICDAM